MKKLLIIAAMTLTSLSAHAAPLTDFKGIWKNNSAGSITKIKIRTLGSDDVRVKVFASCSPTDCNWGTSQAAAFGPSSNGHLSNNTKSLMTVYNQGFAKKTVLMTLTNPTHMNVKIFTEFLDASGRANYVKQVHLVKQNNTPPSFIHFSSVGIKQVQKVVYLPYQFNLNAYGPMKALKISAADAPINIQSAVIVYQNGMHRSLDALLGTLHGNPKTALFNLGNVARVIITATSPNVIGSRGSLLVSAGMPQ